MFFSGNFSVRETKSAYVVSIIGESNKVRITKKEVENVLLYEETEMVAALFGTIELARIDQIANKSDYNPAYIPERIIQNKDILAKINFLLECKMITIDALINMFSEMKYFQIVKFFEEDTEDMYEELTSYN